MKAAVLAQYGKIEWKNVPTPSISDTEVLVRVKYASICGSDQHVFKGEFHPRTSVPMIQGHEFGGVIAKCGKDIADFHVGDRVTVDPIFWCGKCTACKIGHYPACRSLKLLGIDVDGGFAEFVVAKKFMLNKVPPAISDKQAALVEVLAIGFHACKRANVRKDDSIAIYGAGKVGQCILQAVRTKTSNPVFIIDILDTRLQLAQQAYPDIITINARNVDPVSVINEHTNGRGVDIAFEAVGHAVVVPERLHPVRSCIQTIRPVGTVCVLGLSDTEAPLIMKELIFKEAKIISSRVTHGEFSETLHHLEHGHLKPDALISKIMHVSEAQHGFEILEQEPENYLKILLRVSKG